MSVTKDKFGFRLGTKRAIAATLCEKGAIQTEMIAATGTTQYNMLKDAQKRGHHVVEKGDRVWLVHKLETPPTKPERILPPAATPMPAAWGRACFSSTEALRPAPRAPVSEVV